MPTIVPASVLGADAPSNKIQIGQIGCGRIAHEMDMPGILKHDMRPHRRRLRPGLQAARSTPRTFVEGDYAKKTGSDKAVAVKTYGDYRELLKDRPG